jgi:hypothetical protein
LEKSLPHGYHIVLPFGSHLVTMWLSQLSYAARGKYHDFIIKQRGYRGQHESQKIKIKHMFIKYSHDVKQNFFSLLYRQSRSHLYHIHKPPSTYNETAH